MKKFSAGILAGIAFVILAEFAFNAGASGFGTSTLITAIQYSIPLFVLFAQVCLVLGVLLYLFGRGNPAVRGFFNELSANGSELALITACTAMLSSLFYSQVLGYVPCELCWYQRIFMYPLTFIIGVGVFTNKRDIFDYVLPLTIIGSIFSIYHYNEQFLGLFASCATTCGIKVAASFGYLTIPLMALTASLSIACLLYLDKKCPSQMR